MKKMIMMMGAVVCAGIAQAASVSWNITAVSDANGDALGTGKAYVFFVQGTTKADTSAYAQNMTIAALTELLDDANFSYTHGDISSAAAGTWTYASTTGVTPLTNAELGLTGATKYSVFAVITDTEDLNDSTKWMVTSATAASTTYGDSSGSTKAYAIGNQATASGTWYSAVPEPTSGLLMLLGMAGLALKRKRA